MRKTTFALGLGLALSLGAANLGAQQQEPQRGKGQAGEQARRGPRGGEGRFQRGDRGPGALLKGITLSEAQKAQLKTLREQQRTAAGADREAARQGFEELRAARQRGDTAAVRKLAEQRRAAATQQRERQVAALRAILTAEQRATFDKNLADTKAKAAQRASQVRERGPRAGHAGHRGRAGK